MIGKIICKGLFLGCMLLSVQRAQAQWNAIAGYEVFGADIPQFNGLVDALNIQQTNPEKLVPTIKLLHGFVVGGRYSYALGAFELVYRRSLTRRRGLDFDIGANNIKELDISYSMAAWSLNFEFGKGVIVGGSIDYNILKQGVKYGGSGADNFRSFKDKQFSWGNRVFVGVHIANSSSMSFSLRPFYQWHWSTTGLTKLRDQLRLTSEVCELCLEQPQMFGVSLIIKNGQQD